MNTKLLFVLFVAIAFGCAPTGLSSSDRRHLQSLEVQRAREDARASANIGDYAFLGIAGMGTYVPSLPEGKRIDYLSEKDVKAIPGTSDMIFDEEHRRLQENAREYASLYNSEMVRLRQSCGDDCVE